MIDDTVEHEVHCPHLAALVAKYRHGSFPPSALMALAAGYRTSFSPLPLSCRCSMCALIRAILSSMGSPTPKYRSAFLTANGRVLCEFVVPNHPPKRILQVVNRPPSFDLAPVATS